jgi:putative endonuclease
MNHMDLGALGEKMAEAHLKAQAYRIRDRNWRFGKDEIDIVAEKGNYVVFVEVKTRKTGSLMSPLAAVNRAKRAFMIRAANIYMQRYDLDLNARFDIISIETDGNESQLEHIEDAFYPTIRL